MLKKQNLNNCQEKTVPKAYFRGEVVIREILNEDLSLEQEMYHVLFKNGAKTSIHYHESEQVLICTKGIGIVGLLRNNTNLLEFETKDIESLILLNEDDVACIPKLRLHFHGCLNKDDFSHTAIRRKHVIENSVVRYASTIWETDILNDLLKSNKSTVDVASVNLWEKINSAIKKYT